MKKTTKYLYYDRQVVLVVKILKFNNKVEKAESFNSI